MKATSDQPARPTSVRPTIHGRRLGPALVVVGGHRALRTVDAPLGIAALLAPGAHAAVPRAAPEWPKATEPAELDLEELRVLQPRDGSEGEHAGQGEEGVADHEDRHRAGDIATGEDQLCPDAGRQEHDRGPAGEAVGVAEAEVQPVGAGAPRDPRQPGVRRPERAE